MSSIDGMLVSNPMVNGLKTNFINYAKKYHIVLSASDGKNWKPFVTRKNNLNTYPRQNMQSINAMEEFNSATKPFAWLTRQS